MPEETDKPDEKGINLNGTEFLQVSQLMKTNEIANPVPVGLFSTDAVVMQTHHCPDLFTQMGFSGTLHSWLLNCFLYSGNERVKRGGQTSKFKHQR
ncbi:hypothetical protein D3C86_1922600 [compost metagenome]